MDVYHKMLLKLFEVTKGRDTNKVDFADLVKKEGFHPSYSDIFKQMSQSGWINEAGRADVVVITHWGVMEAKKLLAGRTDNSKELEKQSRRLRANVKEFLVITDDFLSDFSEEKFALVEQKFDEIKNGIGKVKNNL